MAGVYMIGVRWVKTPRNNDLIENALAPLGQWVRFDGNIWFLRTEKSAIDIYAAMAKILKQEDQELITRVDPLDYSGWTVQWLVDWLHQNAR